MTYEDKVAKAQSLIEKFNEGVEDSLKINFENFLKNLKEAGGATEEILSLCSYEDIQDFGGVVKIPRLLAKQIAKIFREKKKVEEPVTKYVSDKKAAQLSPKELLERYDPLDHKNPVGKRLHALSEGQPCLVFANSNTINVEVSLECLNEIREGLSPRTTAIVDSVPQKVYKVGSRPASLLDENPLVPGEPLRGAKQLCDKTHRSWKGIGHEIRVLLYLARERTRELIISYPAQIHDVLALVEGKDADAQKTTVYQRFPQAAMLYKQLGEEGKLPTLKIRPGSKQNQDPFHRSKHKTY